MSAALSPVAFQIGPIAVHWYGLFMAASILLGFWYFHTSLVRRGYHSDFLYNTVVLAVAGGIVGARLVYVFTNWADFAGDLVAIIRIDQGGLSFHGGILGGILVATPYVLAKRANWGELADRVVPGIAIGIALVRIANIINNEVLGRVTVSGFRHPAQLYGSLIGVALLVSYFVMARRRLPPGYLFWSFALYYSLLRGVFEETFRDNPLYAVGYVNDQYGVGFFTLTQLFTPLFVALAWVMRRRTVHAAPRSRQRVRRVRRRGR